MHIYNVGYGTYEESSYTQFISDRQLGDDELSVIVEDCLFECLKIEIKAEINYKKQNPDPDPYYHRDTITTNGMKILSPTMGDLFATCDNDKYGGAFRSEMAKRGLKPVEFKESLSVFGWVSSVDSTSWGDQNDDITRGIANNLRKRVESEGMIIESKNDEDSVSE